MAKFECNACGDTESVNDPCKFEINVDIINEDILVCPITGDAAEFTKSD